MTLSNNNNPSSNVMRPFGYSSTECGYCKGDRAYLVNKTPKDCSKSYGMLADQMSAGIYEKFVERGWRRSGIHLYRPCNFESCCPTLTIRLLAPQFEITKSQQRVAKKMQNLLEPKKQQAKQKTEKWEQSFLEGTGMLQALQESIQNALQACLSREQQQQQQQQQHMFATPVLFRARKASKQEQKKGTVQLTCSVCAQVAGKLQLNRQELVQQVVNSLETPIPQNGVTVVSTKAHAPSGQILVTLKLEDSASKPDTPMPDASLGGEDDKLARWYNSFTGKTLKPQDRKLHITTLAAHESALLPEVHKLYADYQHAVHQDPDPFSNNSNNNNPASHDEEEEPSGPINIEDLDWGNAPAYFTRRIPAMLKQYCQQYASGDEKRRTAILSNYYSFYQFLVESPFPLDDEQPSAPPRCGTYHQHYKIGNVLVAVGVVDILPKGFSSVYLIYNPSFSHDLVALGKYAILKEVDYTNDTLKLPYYYLGYYIESCPKMRYKGEYKPSELLCPKYYQWVKIPEAIPKLQQTPRHVCALVEESEDFDPKRKHARHERQPDADLILDRIPMDIGGGFNVTLNMLQDSGKHIVRPILEEFLEEAGPELSQECLVKLS